MQWMRKSILLAVLVFLSNYASAYTPNADWFINAYSQTWTEKWLANDLSRRQMELAKAKRASGDFEEDNDESEGDELFDGGILFSGQGLYYSKSGQFSSLDSYGIYGLQRRYPKSLYNIGGCVFGLSQHTLP